MFRQPPNYQIIAQSAEDAQNITNAADSEDIHES
jgi:hypothetical protein